MRHEEENQFQRKKHIAWYWVVLASFAAGIVVLFVIIFVSVLTRAPTQDEFSAPALLRYINTAEVTYSSSNQGNYGSIPQLISQGLLPAGLARTVHGYVFTVTPTSDGYTAAAFPTSKDAGRFGYYSNTDGVIRYATSKSATCDPCFPQGRSGKPLDP